ncbi:tRNA pseudouridine(38-40) synthase TruA [Diplocloster agilis]|uniref:tRNA pseudouridine synthase A n=1 Tax=Diplocloster agilis TaxID=2850323 RepID=A0A949K6N2_9FIRM|nr:tRNA pseudouridine(38-40) synthase TruA [Diplocloster agilis]MBU9738636.1 tRNA pseudouridine(38-40) synthase TruA [Diplocloster agilis]
MKRIKLTVAYDGTNYSGFQIQNNASTIEGELKKCLTALLQEEVELIGASRTDAGVHALGNVAVFDTDTRIPAEKISYALNVRLPEDIRIQHSCQVSSDWHPRYQNTIKTYEYRIYNRPFPNPVVRLYSHHVYWSLDDSKMAEAAKYLTGEHDFASFCSAGAQVQSTVRTIYEAAVQAEESGMITIRLKGNGFLYNMVRIIAGTLMEAGRGSLPPEQVQDILAACDRSKAGPTAPAKGLTLMGIQYL